MLANGCPRHMSKSYEYEANPIGDLLLVISTTRQTRGFLQRWSARKDSTGTLERLFLTSMVFVSMLLEGGASFRPKQATTDPRTPLRDGLKNPGSNGWRQGCETESMSLIFAVA